MNLEQFEELLAEHGADIRKWPRRTRRPAVNYLKTHGDTRAEFAAWKAVEAALGPQPLNRDLSGLTERILQATREATVETAVPPAPRRSVR